MLLCMLAKESLKGVGGGRVKAECGGVLGNLKSELCGNFDCDCNGGCLKAVAVLKRELVCVVWTR